MGIRSDGTGHGDVWKILIGLSVACAVLVFVGGFLHRRALDAAITERQAKSVAWVSTKVVAESKQTDLAKPLKDPEAAQLTKQLDLPAGTDLRLFSPAGLALYNSPGLAPFAADAEGIEAAASGDPSHVVDGSDLRVYVPVAGKGAKPVAIAAVVSNYTQLRNDASGPLDGIRLPIVALGVVLLIAGLLLMLQSTKGAAPARASTKPAKEPAVPSKVKATSSAKGRVTGFEPVPVSTAPNIQRVEAEEDPEVEPEPAAEDASAAEPAVTGKSLFGLKLGTKKPKAEMPPATEESVVAAAAADPVFAPGKSKRSLFARKGSAAEPVEVDAVPSEKAASALDREVAIRQALEDQLEQLRTRIQMQDVETANAQKELLAQVEAANRRAEEAEARANDTGAGAPPVAPAVAPAAAPDEAALRVQQLEREVAEARSVTADAVARAETLQRQLDEAPAAPGADPGAAAKVEEAMAQLADAQQRASAAEQRAASVESVRDELEVRVAQLGTKASDLEQRATDLETSLHEANAGGDAVRAEIATLTAALAAANARVTELESAPAPTAAPNEEDQAEIAKLRGELANHMERAQAAEERAATLEADVLAAQRGVSSLPIEAHEEPSTNGEPPSATVDVPADDRTMSRFQAAEMSERVEAEDATPEPNAVADREPAALEAEAREDDVPASQTHVASPPTVEDAHATGDEPSDAAEAVTGRDPSRDPELPNRWGSFAETEGSAVQPRTESNEGHAAEEIPVEASVPRTDAAEPEIDEPEPVEADVHEPVEAALSPEIAPPAVEWRAPTPSPEPVAAASASSNGNAIPPAPSDEARYDDIWTAAFAPPAPETESAHVEATPDTDRGNVEQQPDTVARSQPADPAPVEASAETTPSDHAVSPEDQPSPPEDELSAEDDMWSLRARLAEAAARKKPSHELD